jgi:hypothetical protein
MKVRFVADVNFDERIISGLLRREPTIDFHTLEVLTIAADSGRILVTHDLKTMLATFGKFAEHAHCPGVILVPQDLARKAVNDDLLLIWSASEAEDWTGIIARIPY